MQWNNSLYGSFRNLKFTDIWSQSDTFLAEYGASPFGSATINVMSDDMLSLLFYFLYSRYGNSVIASSDVNQFKYKVYSIIFEYGPNWAKKLDLQNKLRTLADDEIVKGSKNISNHSYNPASAPSTGSLDELETIDQQNTNMVKRSKIDAYSLMYDLLVDDITTELLERFKKLFLMIVAPEIPLWYVTDSEEDIEL